MQAKLNGSGAKRENERRGTGLVTKVMTSVQKMNGVVHAPNRFGAFLCFTAGVEPWHHYRSVSLAPPEFNKCMTVLVFSVIYQLGHYFLGLLHMTYSIVFHDSCFFIDYYFAYYSVCRETN